MKNNLILCLLASTAMLISCDNGGGNQDGTDNDTTMTMEEGTDETAEGATMTATLNENQSSVMWTGTMLGVYAHTGTVDFKEGNLIMEDGKIVGGSFTVNLGTIVPTDENYNPEEGKSKEKLVGHLQSDDFFHVEEHPTARFEITGSSPEENKLMGNLTIRGITHEETVEDVSYDPASKTATGKLVFDRKKYNVNWDSPQDVVLSDDVELAINLTLQE